MPATAAPTRVPVPRGALETVGPTPFERVDGWTTPLYIFASDNNDDLARLQPRWEDNDDNDGTTDKEEVVVGRTNAKD